MKKGSHGGARDGAGRPALPDDERKRGLKFSLPPDVASFIETLPSRSKWLEELIKRSSDFKNWRKNQS